MNTTAAHHAAKSRTQRFGSATIATGQCPVCGGLFSRIILSAGGICPACRHQEWDGGTVLRAAESDELRKTVGRLTEQLQRLGVGVARDSWDTSADYDFVIDDWKPGECRMALRFDGLQETPAGPLAQFTEQHYRSAACGATFTIPVHELDAARLKAQRQITAQTFAQNGRAA